MKRAVAMKAEGMPVEVVDYCQARAWVSTDGFYHFCWDILGYKDMYEPFHGPICDFVMDPHRYKMLQACRGSFKSSIATYGYIAWKIGKEYIETGAVNRRYLIACENMTLALKFVRHVKQICEDNQYYIRYFGNHKGSKNWTDFHLTSCFRTDARIAEPTVSAIAIDADRTGFHVEEVICDDLESQRNSASREQIEACWRFYRLLHSIMEPASARNPGSITIVSTRWHYDDIYARILERNLRSGGKEKFKTLIRPAVEGGELAFPTRYDWDTLDDLREEQGPYIFSCQYLLDPVPDEERTFKSDWILDGRADDYQQKGLKYYTGADYAYTEKMLIDTGESRKADYTAILTFAVDQYWNYYLVDWFHERCTKLEAVQESFRQCHQWKSLKLGLQKFDRAQMKEFIDHYTHTYPFKPPYIEWVSYPSQQKKNDRIESSLQGLFMSKKIRLLPNADWLKDELLDFPHAAYDDGLDAMCNVIAITRPPKPSERPKEKKPPALAHILRLHKGLDPNPAKGKSWKNVFAR